MNFLFCFVLMHRIAWLIAPFILETAISPLVAPYIANNKSPISTILAEELSNPACVMNNSVCLFLNKVDTLKSTIMKKKEEQLQISLDRVKLQKHVYELCRVQKLTINEVRKKTGLGMGTIYRYLHTFEEENPKLVEQMKKQGPNIIPEDYKKLQEEVLRLKCELKREKLRADFYEEMVAFGKEVYGIDLKKAGTK